METRPERVRPTLFVPGRSPSLEDWRVELKRDGLTLEQGSLSGSALDSPIAVEWVSNPRDGSFGQAFSFGTVPEPERSAIDATPGALVLSLHADLHTACVPIVALVRVLARCGGLAVRIEESKLGFTIERWLELVSAFDLYRAAVLALCGKADATSCGMHAFSLPDASVAIDGETDMAEARRLVDALNRFQIDEGPLLVNGQTFSPDAESPKRVLQRWPDAGYPEGHACHNPFGIWRMGAAGSRAQPPDGLAYVFMPSLVATLLHAEQQSGRPLTREQVAKITESGECVAMKHRDAQKLERQRGYADLDPELAWEQWQVYCRR